MTSAPRVSITYCTEWNYQPIAAGLAAAIKDELAQEVALVPGRGGVLDIRLDEQVVFSKFTAGYKPEPEEAVALLRPLL